MGPIARFQKPTGWSAGRQRVGRTELPERYVPPSVSTLSTCLCMLGTPSWL